MARILALFVVCFIGLVLPTTSEGFKILSFYHGTWDVAHISFCREANKWFPSVAAANGFEYEATTDWSKMNDNYLQNVDVILLLDDKPQESNQKAAFQKFVENGGGVMMFHVSAFTTNSGEWSWYHTNFLGSGNFQRNTWKPTSAVLQVENRGHPATINLPDTFKTQPNEWYAWNNNLQTNSKIRILLSIHASSFPLGTNPDETWHSGYFPVVWTNTDYRMLYVNMGHNDIDYSNGNADLSATFGGEIQNRFFLDSLKWLAGGNQVEQNPLLKAFGH